MKFKYAFAIVIILTVLLSCEKKDSDEDLKFSTYYYYLREDNSLSSSPSTTNTSIVHLQGNVGHQWRTLFWSDLNGDNYSFNIWAKADKKSSFQLDIIVVQSGIETILASWEDITTTDPDNFVQVKGNLNGHDPTTELGDMLILRITNTGPYNNWVTIKCSPDHKSHIKISN